MKELSALFAIAFNELLKNEAKYEQRVQVALLEALNLMRGEMQTIYDKYAVGGLLTVTEMAKYNRYAEMEKQMMGILDPILKDNVLTIRTFLPEQYKEAFYRNAWALDNGLGVHLGINIIRKEVLTNLFSITNVHNMYMREALQNYNLDGKKKIRQALMNGLSLGKSMPSMARDLKQAVNITYSKALGIIRTEGMGALNAGTNDAYMKSLDRGVDGKVTWSSTKDLKTRPATRTAKGNHREMDGQVQDKDGLFHLHYTGETAPYPGFAGLSAGQRINCRCVLRMEVDGISPTLMRTREQGVLPYMSYNKWFEKYHGDVK